MDKSPNPPAPELTRTDIDRACCSCMTHVWLCNHGCFDDAVNADSELMVLFGPFLEFKNSSHHWIPCGRCCSGLKPEVAECYVACGASTGLFAAMHSNYARDPQNSRGYRAWCAWCKKVILSPEDESTLRAILSNQSDRRSLSNHISYLHLD